ncbi:hypothetical protein Hanom_Chr10g00923041 [Helianthus anomalus]
MILATTMRGPACMPHIPSCISRMRYVASWGLTHRRSGPRYAIIGVIHDVVPYWMTLTWRRGTEGFWRISMRISFAKCWKLVDASFDSASADLFSLRLICRILNEVNFDVSCRACSR